jgi:adenosylcobyric acid synthase
MYSLSIFGTSSDAGKSTLAFAITYLLHKRGIKVAPFKAQNVSNNSVVCDSGGEIAQPQAFAAESIGLKTTPLFNPVLLKSGNKNSASMILGGVEQGQKDVRQYYRDINQLKPIVESAFLALKSEYDCIVAEGAGSPVELNLMDKDLSNIYIATRFNTKIILVADIERGGVFASIYGVYNLLPPDLQKNVIGVIVNKFRGDMTLFDEGVKIIEEQFNIPVLGVVGYRALNMGFEDSASLYNYVQHKPHAKIRVAVIAFAHISNFTDFEPLVLDPEVHVSFVSNAHTLSEFDIIILPGSKRVVSDYRWMHESGFCEVLQNYTGVLVGICGGYEMMHTRILDPEVLESDEVCVEGLGLIEGDVTFDSHKVISKGEYDVFGLRLKGYEIHYAKSGRIGVEQENLFGTFLHGVFDNDTFRLKLFSSIEADYQGYSFDKKKEQEISDFASYIESKVDIESLITALG